MLKLSALSRHEMIFKTIVLSDRNYWFQWENYLFISNLFYNSSIYKCIWILSLHTCTLMIPYRTEPFLTRTLCDGGAGGWWHVVDVRTWSTHLFTASISLILVRTFFAHWQQWHISMLWYKTWLLCLKVIGWSYVRVVITVNGSTSFRKRSCQ